MITRKLKIFIPILISLAVLVIFYQKAQSCAISFEGDDRYINIFDKSMFNLPELKPFFLSSHAFADMDERDVEKSAFSNLKEWTGYTKNIAVLDDIETIVYSAPLDTLSLIENAVNRHDKSLIPEGYKHNSFVRYLVDNKKEEAVKYLIYAKNCEPQVTYYDPWLEHGHDSAAKNNLYLEGLKHCKERSSKFIKDRYAYQTVRLAHYTQRYEETVSLYNKYFGSQNDGDLIRSWALAHKAGALMSMDKIPEANLLFAKVFDKCVSRRKQAVLSMKLKDNEMIEKTLKLCRTPQEKILVYTLSTYGNNSRCLTSMEKVFKLNPRSEYLQLLLQRAVTEYERDMLPQRDEMFFKNYLSLNKDIYREIDSVNMLEKDKAYGLICRIAESKKVPDAYLWNFAAGYIASLENRYAEALNYYYEAKRNCPKNDFQYIRRIQTAETIAEINNKEKIDKKFEESILPGLRQIDNMKTSENSFGRDAYLYMLNLLAKKYLAQGDTVKAHLCLGAKNEIGYMDPFGYNILTEYQNYPIDKIYGFIKSVQSENSSSDFDRYLVSKYTYTSDEIEMIQAKYFICTGNFKEALEKINNNEYRDDVYLKADPFKIEIKDDHDRDYNAKNKDIYTIKSFCEKMIELDSLAQYDRQNAAKYYFMMANGLYNKTYYGNSWFASAFYRGVYSYGFKELFDCSQAQVYYLKAFNESKDKEFKARCLFMAAKCEQNTYFNNKYYNKSYDWEYVDEETFKVPVEYRTYFMQLKNEYRDTQYYNEILKECKYFNKFVNR
jgi:hypothetical protein